MAVQPLWLLKFIVYGTACSTTDWYPCRQTGGGATARAADLTSAAHEALRGNPEAPRPTEDLVLRPITGPRALGGGRRRAVELLLLLAVTDFPGASYFGTALGYLWSLARPLTPGVLLAVFTQVFRLGSQVLNYPVLLLFNIVLFGFFQEATLTAVNSLASQEP